MNPFSFSAILIDDEDGSISTLSMLLGKYFPGVKILGTFNRSLDAVEPIRKLKPDVVFLDIEMPFANGFELLDKLSPVSFEVIFVTAFSSYAIKAIKYAAVDYLLKPVSIDELDQAVQRAARQLQLRKGQMINSRIQGLLDNIKQNDADKYRLTLPTINGFVVIEIAAIMYLEASGSYCNVYLADGRQILISRNLKEFEDLLPEKNFIRIHHSYLINILMVAEYNKGRGGQVQMLNGVMLEVAVRKKQEFLSKFEARMDA